MRQLEEILCEESDAVSLLSVTENLRALYQWVRVDELGAFTIFDKKPENEPTYAWKDTLTYIPLSERLCREFEEKCAKAGPLLMTAADIIEITGRLILSLERNHKIQPVRRMKYMEILGDCQIMLERKKSEDLMGEMQACFRKDKYPHPKLWPMFDTFKRYNHED